jgi:hypothetical protein
VELVEVLLPPVVLSTRNISEENIDSVLGGRGRMGIKDDVCEETDVFRGKGSIRWFCPSRVDLQGWKGVELVQRRGIVPV